MAAGCIVIVDAAVLVVVRQIMVQQLLFLMALVDSQRIVVDNTVGATPFVTLDGQFVRLCGRAVADDCGG